MDDQTRHGGGGWHPPGPPQQGFPCEGENFDMQVLIDSQERVISNQANLIRYYQDLLNLEGEDGHDGDRQPPWVLWDGPYPLSVGLTPPTQVKVWFNTGSNTLTVWNFATTQWQPVLPTVIVQANAPSPATLGMLWIDSTGKLWVHIDDWRELTMPVIGGPTPLNGSLLTSSIQPPVNPVSGNLWFEPVHQDLRLFNGFAWLRLGVRVERNVRNANWINTWNAGGNRGQGVRAGELLYVAGMRGISPTTQQQVIGPGAGGVVGPPPYNDTTGGLTRNIQIWDNIKVIVEAEGLSLFDCYGITTAVTNLAYLGVTIQAEAQPQFYGAGPYPPRTHEVWLQMSGSDNIEEFPITGWPVRGDITEITSMFFTGRPGRRRPSGLANELPEITGAHVGVGVPPKMAKPVPVPPPTPPQIKSMEETPPPKHHRKRK